MTREDAYPLVQQNALKAFDSKTLFEDMVKKDSQIMEQITEEEFGELFSLDKYKAHVELIYSRVY